EQTWQALHEIDPDVPVVLCSGYAMDETIRTLLERGAAGFIQKPFSQSALLDQVDAALVQGKSSS
ncbi:MAG: response regulator, partial [Planctomycetota bacterium]